MSKSGKPKAMALSPGRTVTEDGTTPAGFEVTRSGPLASTAGLAPCSVTSNSPRGR